MHTNAEKSCAMQISSLLVVTLCFSTFAMAQEPTEDLIEPRFMAIGKNDPAFLQTVADAQASMPFFLKTYKQHKDNMGVFFGIKVPIRDGDTTAHIWYAYRGIEDGLHMGQAFELPSELSQYDTVRVKSQVIEDWMVNDHGHLYGGFSIRLQRAYTAPHERAQFDEYTGIKVYEATPF